MALKLIVGPEVIRSYKRLAYTAWHAIAEFVDNSTQSYFDNSAEIDAELARTGDIFIVSVAYDRNHPGGFLRVSDNAYGMSYSDLERALHLGLPPVNLLGRGQFGLGLKTAACWLGNRWVVRTKRLGETSEHQVAIDVEGIASGTAEPEYREIPGKAPEAHFTVVEVFEHHRSFMTRTIGKIRQFLSSMYREDLRRGVLRLEWNGEPLSWTDIDGRLLRAPDDTVYKKLFAFEVDGKSVHGWVGVLEHGSRADAGFSIIHRGRVIRGWPDSWRPESLYGQIQGSNDLVNQRLVGEIHLDEFLVSHTKDEILWFGLEEDRVQEGLREYCGDYRERAIRHRSRKDDQRGPSDVETKAAIDELKRELTSPEMVDVVRLVEVVPPAAIEANRQRIAEIAVSVAESFRTEVANLTVRGYVKELSPNDPYVTVDSTRSDEVLVVANMSHPHWLQIKGSDGVLNYLRHCTYDAMAEWLARRKTAPLDPDTIKLLKDKLLRVPMEIEAHQTAPVDGAEDGETRSS